MEENKIKDKAESWFALNAYKGYDKYDVFEAGYKAGLESQSALNDKLKELEMITCPDCKGNRYKNGVVKIRGSDCQTCKAFGVIENPI